MICRPLRCKWILCCVILAAPSSTLHAQEKIKWRTDYNMARKEAEARNLPIFIDFFRDPCPPCIRMDQTTFSDPRIAAILNEKFIPLKINGPVERVLIEKLQIELFPTFVLAGPDGRITNTLVGYQDAESLGETVQRLLISLTPPDPIVKDLENAIRWENEGDYARAISTLRNILDDPRERPIQKNAHEVLKRIQQRAEDRINVARDLHAKNQNAAAINTLTEMMRSYPGLQATKDAADLISKIAQSNREQMEVQKATDRTRRARDLLAQAKEFYRTRDYIPCVDRCKYIIANFGDLPEGQQAFALSSEIRSNPEWLQGAADVLGDLYGDMLLALAESHLKQNDVSKARYQLQRVIQIFPGTRLSESAQLRLSQLQTVAIDRK